MALVMDYHTLLILCNQNKFLVGKILLVTLLLLLSMNVVISNSPKSVSGQQRQDDSLSFIKHLNSSSYFELAEDERFVREITFEIREVGNAMITNSSLCSIIDDIDRCDSVALSLTNYLINYNFEDAISKIGEAKNRLTDFQQNPTFETLNSFAKANSDVAKSLYDLLVKATISSEGLNILNGNVSINAEAGSVTSELSRILMDAGQLTKNNSWISSGESLITLMSNFEQKYSDINAITGITNTVEVDSLPRNDSGLYAIGFGVAGALIAAGIIIQVLLRRKKQNQYRL
jgi:hypothetical protein